MELSLPVAEASPVWPSAPPQQAIFEEPPDPPQASPSARPPAQDSSAPEALDAAAERLAGSFEKYQRLFAESERPGASDNPILAALDAAIQSPTADQALPKAAAEPAPAVPEQPPNLDLEKDVDWGESPKRATALLGRVAAAIPLAEVPATTGAATKESGWPKPASSGAAFADLAVEPALPARARGRADSRLDDDGPDSTGPYSASQRRSRRRGGRSRLETSSTLLIFSFVASVILALGTGFIAGFVVGRSSPSDSEPRAQADNETQAKPQRSDSAADDGDDGLEILKEPGQTAAATTRSPGAAAAPQPASKPYRPGFDQKSAGAALSKAQSRAGLCVQPGEPGGTAVVTVTFEPSGAASNAAIYGTRFSGTPAGECMVKMLRELKVRPFTGEPVTVKKKISVE
jgi:hypothetical protein